MRPVGVLSIIAALICGANPVAAECPAVNTVALAGNWQAELLRVRRTEGDSPDAPRVLMAPEDARPLPRDVRVDALPGKTGLVLRLDGWPEYRFGKRIQPMLDFDAMALVSEALAPKGEGNPFAACFMPSMPAWPALSAANARPAQAGQIVAVDNTHLIATLVEVTGSGGAAAPVMTEVLMLLSRSDTAH